jgi:hypothetical protein
MNNGKFMWLCGEYLILVNLEVKTRLTDSKDDYKMELQRDTLLLSFNGLDIPLDDEQISVYRLNKGVSLSKVSGIEDYGEVALSIDMFTGIKDLFTLPYVLIHVQAS